MGRGIGLLRAVSGIFVLGATCTLAGGLLTGCAVAPGSLVGVDCEAFPHQTVEPATAVADHDAAPPGNQVQFTFPLTQLPAGCAQAQYVSLPYWVSSDPISAPIGNASGATNGVATCVGATTVPVTISTTLEGAASAGLLTCK